MTNNISDLKVKAELAKVWADNAQMLSNSVQVEVSHEIVGFSAEVIKTGVFVTLDLVTMAENMRIEVEHEMDMYHEQLDVEFEAHLKGLREAKADGDIYSVARESRAITEVADVLLALEAIMVEA